MVVKNKEGYAATDVADPSIILDKRESAFVERWEDRKKDRQPKPRPTVKTAVRVFRNQHHKWTERDVLIFTREWNRGTTLKAIGNMLDPPRSEKAMLKMRCDLALPLRKRANDDKRVSIPMSEAMYRAMGSRSRELGKTRAAYLRLLLARDLGVDLGYAKEG